MLLLSSIALAAEEAAGHTAEAVSSGGLGAIGVDVRVLLFQLINFAILLWLLKRVAYKPIMKILSERRHKIEEGLETAKQMEAAKAQLTEEQAKVMAQARNEAEAISARARTEAAETIKKAEAAAATRTEQMLETAEARIASELEKTRIGLKREVLGLVTAATEAVIDEKLDEKKDAALLSRALKEAERV